MLNFNRSNRMKSLNIILIFSKLTIKSFCLRCGKDEIFFEKKNLLYNSTISNRIAFTPINKLSQHRLGNDNRIELYLLFYIASSMCSI